MDKTEKNLIINFLVLVAMLILCDLVYNIFNYGYVFVSSDYLLLSIVIVLPLIGVVFAISGKSHVGMTFASVLFILLTVVNQIKIIYTGEPVEIMDVLYLGNARRIGWHCWRIILEFYTKLYISIFNLRFNNGHISFCFF